MLEHSLHGASLIALGLQEQPDALAHPWQLVLHHPAGTPQALPAGTHITQVYDAAQGELLILGAPGSGKTTLLLELTRELLDRAEHDEHHPLPVVFNLSSWAMKQQPLADWLVEELNRTYQVPRQLGQTLVETDQILPLLDGLDEVALKARTACIETINTYRQEHGLLPLVICSRSADYLAQSARIRLGSAVAVQPLSQQQVDDYLASGGEPLWALRVALHQDSALRELTETPLMLSILTLTYHDMPIEELLRGGIAPTRQQVFEYYVERMLRQRGAVMRYTHEQTTHYLEHLQPDWLGERRRRLLYRLTVGLFAGLVVGLVVGLVGEPVGGLINGLIGGLGAGLIGGLVSGLDQIQPREILTLTWMRTKRSIVMGLRVWLVVGLVYGLIGGLGGLIGGLVYEPVGRLIDGLIDGLKVGLVTGLVAMLVAGFSTSQLDDRLRSHPNQGIWRSARNGLVVGLSVYLAALVAVLVTEPGGGLFFGQVLGLPVGLVVMLVFGLGTFFQHFALRFWLWRTGSLPWNLVALLDEAAERLLLRKVGGGYIFVHRLLLEYFASLDTTPTPDAARAKKEQAEPAS